MVKKKMRFIIPSLFKNREQQLWHWPSCKHPKTLSFRASPDHIFFSHPKAPESWFTNSSLSQSESESASLSTESEDQCESSLETVVRGVRSDRLFFEPGSTSSILEAKTIGFPFQESVVLAVDSHDPYGDFRRSMEEMLHSHAPNHWEELLTWYLKLNANNNHGFILAAFLDLLAALPISRSNSSSLDSLSFSSAVSSSSSPLHEIEIEIDMEEEQQ